MLNLAKHLPCGVLTSGGPTTNHPRSCFLWVSLIVAEIGPARCAVMSKSPRGKRQLPLIPEGHRQQLLRRTNRLVLNCLGLLVLGSAGVPTTTTLVEQKPMFSRQAQHDPRKVRVAVCFYGLTRSLRWTLPSIRRRLFEVLRQEGMEVDVFVHTYHLLEVRQVNISSPPSLTIFRVMIGFRLFGCCSIEPSHD